MTIIKIEDELVGKKHLCSFKFLNVPRGNARQFLKQGKRKGDDGTYYIVAPYATMVPKHAKGALMDRLAGHRVPCHVLALLRVEYTVALHGVSYWQRTQRKHHGN